jgi:hypothetical protein
MAKDKVELDALSAMGFSVGCQVIAMREAITSQLGLSPDKLGAFNAAYDKAYSSEMEMLIEELEDEGPAVAELLREMVSQKAGESEGAEPRGVEFEGVEPAEGSEPEESPVGTEATLQEKIEAACASVVAEEPCLLSRKLHERTIAGRIAYYLQPLMTEGYFVDCAYDKTADGLGAGTLKKLSEHGTDSVTPDIIIHDRKRGTAGNLAVIEAKWSGDKAAIEQEKIKIGLFMKEPKLAYKSGFLILLKKDSISVQAVETN